MIRTIKLLCIFILLIFLNMNCAIGPNQGALISIVKFPGNYNLENDVKPSKTAKGCEHSILGLFGFGDSGAGSIAKTNNIQRIAIVDHSTMNIFLGLLYKNYCTIVSGE